MHDAAQPGRLRQHNLSRVPTYFLGEIVRPSGNVTPSQPAFMKFLMLPFFRHAG